MNALSRPTGVALVALLAASTLLIVTPASAAPAPTLPRFVNVVTSYSSSAALTDQGEVYSWGYGPSLGLAESVLISPTPQLVTFTGKPSDDPVIELALGIDHGVALTEAGEVWVWGQNDYGQLGLGAQYDTVWEPTPVGIADYLHVGEKVVHIAAGDDHSLALTNTSGLFGWGDNYYYQVSYDDPDLNIYTPVEYAAVRDMFDAAGRTATRVSAFDWSSYVVSDEAWAGGERGYAWGYNESGRLGIGTANNGENRGLISFPGSDPTARIVDFDAGVRHGIAVLDDGTMWSWGAVAEGGTRVTPGPVLWLPDPVTSKVVAVAAGQDVSFALTDDGRLFSWGSNGPTGEGQLGTGTVGAVTVTTPTELTTWPAVRGTSRIVDIAGGFRHAAGAVSETGGVYMWGAGWSRGDDSTDDANTPTNIALGDLAAGTVQLSGTPYPGVTMTAVVDGWPTFTTFGDTVWRLQGDNVGMSASYTPGAGDEGLPLTVTLTGTAENWREISVTSAPATVLSPAPQISPSSLADAVAGLPYSAALGATGAPPLTYSLSGGALPDGITLASDGTLSGTATTAGTSSFTVTATNPQGSATAGYSLRVTAGAIHELEVTPSATQVAQGGRLTFTARGFDAYGNPTGDLTAAIVLSSDVATDVVDGNTVTFPHASPHTITASYGQLAVQVTVQVIPAAILGSTGADGGVLLTTTLGALTAFGVGILLIVRQRAAHRASASRRQ